MARPIEFDAGDQPLGEGPAAVILFLLEMALQHLDDPGKKEYSVGSVLANKLVSVGVSKTKENRKWQRKMFGVVEHNGRPVPMLGHLIKCSKGVATLNTKVLLPRNIQIAANGKACKTKSQKQDTWLAIRDELTRQCHLLESSGEGSSSNSVFVVEGISAASPARTGNPFALLDSVTTGENVFGREDEYALLDLCWRDEQTKLVVLHAFGGVGKTSVVKDWKRQLSARAITARQAFGYSFSGQGESGRENSQSFFDKALTWFGESNLPSNEYERAERLLQRVVRQETLLIVDGTEVLQNPLEVERETEYIDNGFRHFLFLLVESQFSGLCVVTTRYAPAEFKGRPPAVLHELPGLRRTDARKLLVKRGVQEYVDDQEDDVIDHVISEYGDNAFALTLVANYLVDYLDGDPRKHREIGFGSEKDKPDRVIGAYERALKKNRNDSELQILQALSVFDEATPHRDVTELVEQCLIQRSRPTAYSEAVGRLTRIGLLEVKASGELDLHSLVRMYFRKLLQTKNRRLWQRLNRVMFRRTLDAFPDKLSALADDPPTTAPDGAATTEGKQHERLVSTQLKYAHHLVKGIQFGCEAKDYWRALATLMVRLDEQDRVSTSEQQLLWKFRIWGVLCLIPRLGQTVGVSALKSLGKRGFGPLSSFYQSADQLDMPTGFYLAYWLEAWALRLQAGAKFYPRQDFRSPPVFPDRLSSSMVDLATSYCLVHTGRSDDAYYVADRARRGFHQLQIKPLAFLSDCGLALLQLHRGHLAHTIELADSALHLAMDKRQRAHALAIRAFGRDLSGDYEGAQDDFAAALRCSPRLSTRVAHFWWRSILRHVVSLTEAEQQFEAEVAREPPPDKQGRHFDYRTSAVQASLHLDYRKAIESQITPTELLDRVLNAYRDFPQHRHLGFYHRSVMQFHEARARAMCAGTSGDLGQAALISLDSAERHAKSGGFGLLQADTLIARGRLLKAMNEMDAANACISDARRLAQQCEYAWALEDLSTM